MKAATETSLETGLFSKGMYSLSVKLTVICILFLFSCEIEDDFGKPDNSYDFGTLLYTDQYNGIYKILWSTEPNQIISIGNNLTLIDVDTKLSRPLNIGSFMYGGDVSWVTGNTFYYLNYNAELSSVNISNEAHSLSLADSITQYPDGVAFSSEYFSFNKWDKFDPVNEPYLYIFDLEALKEMLITTGTPRAFSPDGQTLLFSRNNPNSYTRDYYSYSIQTKAITPLAMQDPYGYSSTIKWTSEGIMFYYQNYNGKTAVYNATTKTQVGEWVNMTSVHYGLISPTGRKMITYREKCATSSSTGNCFSYFRQYYYVVDIVTGTEDLVIFGDNLYASQFAFSADENSAAYTLANNIYLIQSLE